MKEPNYCSLEVSQRLVDAGIKINTENHWCHWDNGEWTLGNGIMETPREFIPAPTFAEIWIELPEDISHDAMVCSLMLWKFNHGKFTEIGYWWHTQIIKSVLNENPADAAAELLIWVKEEKI